MTSSDDETGEADDTLTPPEAIKAERIRTKRNFTQEKRKIEQAMDKNLDTPQLLVRKEGLETLFNNCISINVRYIKKLESLNLVVQDYEWADRLTDEFRSLEDRITRYVAKHPAAPSNNNPLIAPSEPGAAATAAATAAAALQASSVLNSTMTITPTTLSL